MKHLPIVVFLALMMTGCTSPAPKDFSSEVIPAPTRPVLTVYVTADDTLVQMDAETYVACVVAGEMPGDWPPEALRAQAILARTFVMKFITEKASRYPGADISTDVAEAQAYDAASVNDRIRQAVASTAGMVLLTEDGGLPYTWFHAHSGGSTDTARGALDWQGAEPAYTRVAKGGDSPDAPESARSWQAAFPAEEFLAACREAGSDARSCRDVRIGQISPGGRAVTLLADGTEVNAARLRIALGSTVMRSTRLTELRVESGAVMMAGLGYGHGVGMPQWGAYAMAQAGHTGEEIALHYYNGLHIAHAWQ